MPADRSLIVTGAAGGIGLRVAELAASRGARVLAVDRDAAALERAVAGLPAERVAAHVADVTSAEACAEAVQRAEELHGGVGALVNNAGIGAFDMTLDTTTDEQWERVIAVNLTSVFLMSRAALPALRRSGGGAIVNVSSVHALATSRGLVPYAAAKGGVLAMTRALAIDLAPDRIRVVAVLPGATDTPMLRQHAEREGRSLEQLGFSRDPGSLGRVMEPREVAETILFAASDAASALTGSALTADAGLLAGF
ncbi:MAG TPA: SDR family NAD(P)-dependent oxidoreductase [Conexibacter sp.]|nr:SDR family NAD(P)-dependent oxidoreductase [Conexibacter sp.]